MKIAALIALCCLLAPAPTISASPTPPTTRFVPTTEFFLDAGKPPTLVRVAGPWNYAGQPIRLE